MESNTKKGLFFLIIGLIISMICSLITSLSGFLTTDRVISLSLSMFGLISLVGAILMLIGAIMFYMGRKEFGEKHQKNVKKALIVFIITVITLVAVGAVFIMMMIFSVLSALPSTYGNTTYPLPSFTAPTTLMVVVISIVGAVLGGLIYYFALIDLEDETGKKILYVGIVSSIALSIVISYYVSGMLGELFSSLSTQPTDFSAFPYTQNFGKIGILGVIPNLLYLYAFYNPYIRMKNDELKPGAGSSGQEDARPMKKCPNCGKTIPSDVSICTYCYKVLE